MSYKKGDVSIDRCNYDSRDEKGYDDDYRFAGKQVALLPHSCDEWIIGSKEEVEMMIADLQELLPTLPPREKDNQGGV